MSRGVLGLGEVELIPILLYRNVFVLRMTMRTAVSSPNPLALSHVFGRCHSSKLCVFKQDLVSLSPENSDWHDYRQLVKLKPALAQMIPKFKFAFRKDGQAGYGD